VTEQVGRIVPVLQRHEPIVIRAKGGLDAIGSLFGLEADMIDVVAAAREGQPPPVEGAENLVTRTKTIVRV
jgi:hypothetical protein